ncbi:MAG: hypothetical protein WAU78_11710 [Roseiarcus sp.]
MIRLLAALLLLAAWPALAAPRACALVDGRIVAEAEVRAVAASWDAPIAEYRGADARDVAVALLAEGVAIPDDAQSVLAFVVAGRTRVAAIDQGCVRGFGVLDAGDWSRALKLALGEPT